MTSPHARLNSSEETLVAVRLRMAQDPRERQREIARRKANRFASILGGIAAVLAMYDLSLLATIGRP